MTKVIQLTGYPRSGKDEYFKIAKDLYPELDIRRYAYADYLKERHAEELGVSSIEHYNELLHSTNEYHGHNLRNGLSKLGIRLKKEDLLVFVNKVRSDILDDNPDLAIITDMRYWEEYIYATDNNHRMVRVYRCDVPEEEKSKPWNVLTQVFRVHEVIYNVSNLMSYAGKVELSVDRTLYSTDA